jgi:hypothetical protein
VSVLTSIGYGFAALAIAGIVTGRIKRHSISGLIGAEFGAFAVNDIHIGDHLWALVDTAACAWFAYQWWTGGGDDDTKRRLRDWGRKFTGVRRTAPSAA